MTRRRFAPCRVQSGLLLLSSHSSEGTNQAASRRRAGRPRRVGPIVCMRHIVTARCLRYREGLGSQKRNGRAEAANRSVPSVEETGACRWVDEACRAATRRVPARAGRAAPLADSHGHQALDTRLGPTAACSDGPYKRRTAAAVLTAPF